MYLLKGDQTTIVVLSPLSKPQLSGGGGPVVKRNWEIVPINVLPSDSYHRLL